MITVIIIDGVAARAFGLPLELALFGAGMNQVFKEDGKPDWSNKRGYFDHKRVFSCI